MGRRTALFVLALICLACGTLPIQAPVKPPLGVFFTSYRAPLSTDFDETTLGTKHGSATVSYIHDILLTGINLAWGEGDLESAAADGGISEIRYADYELLSILGVFVRFRLHAYGD